MPAEIIHLHSGDGPDLTKDIVNGLTRPSGKKNLPTMLLYDERGLRLYDDITTKAPEYYLFGAEESILKRKADEIVQAMHHGEDATPDEVVLELGAGALRKTSHILSGLSRLVLPTASHAPITYYALDLEEREIERTLGEIATSDVGQALQGKVMTKGICGTYDDGLKFLEDGGLSSSISPNDKLVFNTGPLRDLSPISDFSESSASESSESSAPTTPSDSQRPLHIMFLGSSIGNFTRESAQDFLRALPLRVGCGDTLLLGLDHDNDQATIEEAYNDPEGHTKRFIMNGLKVAGRTLGDESLFDEENWEYVNEYVVAKRQHEAFYKSRKAHSVNIPTGGTVSFAEGEKLKVEQSMKFSEADTHTLFINSNLRPIQRWTDDSQRYSLWLLERPPFTFPLIKQPTNDYSPFGMPTIPDWEQLWAAWDVVTRGMIPHSMLYERPINLRHICLFYLGHIPTFLDIYLSRLLKEPHTEPEEFKYIFERGIDPNIDDPTQCHPHSQVPTKDEDWPSLVSILQFTSRVRARVLKLYQDIKNGKVKLTRRIARVLFMTYEHEAMHVETLLYMLLQRAGTGTIPPFGFAIPPWKSLAEKWNAAAPLKSETVVLGPETITIGHNDLEAEDEGGVVKGHEFGWDNENPKRVVEVGKFRISWRPVTNGEFYAFYTGEGRGKVELPKSWVQNGGEIQVRTLYGPIPMEFAQEWPMMTSYNDLSAYVTVRGGRIPSEPELRLFYQKFDAGYEGGANVGFRNWHPIPATTGGERDGGKGTNGGVWEWTSTTFDKWDGFTGSELYPGYSSDFFDGVHNIVIGGSYATVPHMSERRTLINWYQRNYPYPWVGARIAYDIVDEA